MARQGHTSPKIRPPIQQERAIEINPQHHPHQQPVQPQRLQPPPRPYHIPQPPHMHMEQLRIAKHSLVARHLGHGGDDHVGGWLVRGGAEEDVDGAEGLLFEVQEDGADVGTFQEGGVGGGVVGGGG